MAEPSRKDDALLYTGLTRDKSETILRVTWIPCGIYMAPEFCNKAEWIAVSKSKNELMHAPPD
jgi:hypothetical protein